MLEDVPRFLAEAYPDERRRDHAVRWLGWIADRMGTATGIRWWEITSLAPAGVVVTVRRAVLWPLVGITFALGLGTVFTGRTSWRVAVYLILFYFVLRGFLGYLRGRKGRSAVIDQESPRVLAPHRPTGRDVRWLLLGAIPAGLGILPVLVWRWSADSAPDTAATRGRVRLRCLVNGLAWAPAGFAMGVLPGRFGTSSWLLLALLHGVAAAIVVGAMTGPWAALKFWELALAVTWGERVGFGELLDGAVHRGVLTRHGDVHEFRDAETQAYLAARGAVSAAGYDEMIERRLARPGIRAAAMNFPTESRLVAIVTVTWVGTAIATTLYEMPKVWQQYSPGLATLYSVGTILAGLIMGVIAAACVGLVLLGVKQAARLSLAYLPWTVQTARRRLLAITVLVAAVAVAVAIGGTALAGATAYALPGVLVLACGGRLAWRAHRAVRDPDRGPRRAPEWGRAAKVAIVIAIPTVAAAELAFADRALLGTLPATGLLFPVAFWEVVCLCRLMRGSGRLVVRAGATILASALLGAEFVVFLVWLTNMLGMSRPEVAALRVWAADIGSRADLPWWVWTGVYAALAVAAVAYVRWPLRLRKPARWLRHGHLVTVADISQQALAGLHVGLMAILLVGVASPATVTPLLSRQLKQTYIVAFQRQLALGGEQAAYAAIARSFEDQTPDPVLMAVIAKVHEVSPPTRGTTAATPTELDLARRLGAAQATLALASLHSPTIEQAAQQWAETSAQATGRTEKAANADAHDHIAAQASAVQSANGRNDASAKRVAAAADIAAKMVATAVSIPQLGQNEVVEIVREYLGALIEDSPLAEVFGNWIERIPEAAQPPAANTLVNPDPAQLEAAATKSLSAELTARGLPDPLKNPDVSDPALRKALAEDPAQAAVDILNQDRYTQEQTGPCEGCTGPEFPHKPPPPEEPADHEAHPAEP